MDENQNEIAEEDSSDDLDNGFDVDERVIKQDKKNVYECIGVECEGFDCLEHCSSDKVDTIYRWCKHKLNNDEQFDQRNLQKVKVK